MHYVAVVAKYKSGNFSGALQELISLTQKDPSNPVVYYYLGMAYTQVGNKDQAVKAYENVIRLNSDETLIKYATKGINLYFWSSLFFSNEIQDIAHTIA